ncbi:Eco57I restriction-modification methylase domain-containing protein [Thalassospira lucentensis]|uniref:Eco57I restriction-modification methylase domain-containing protein n=1 Tax=Thalassospira lucentensis TaxID=168935 RepID=UPI00399D75F8
MNSFQPLLLKRKLNEIRLRGVVYTPADVAYELVRYSLAEINAKDVRVLEPSCGEGAFLSELHKFRDCNLDITAVDVDRGVVEKGITSFPRVSFQNQDFFDYSVHQEERFDLVIGNPPYLRRQFLPKSVRIQLQRVSTWADYPLSSIKNVWVAFIVASERLLTQSGMLSMVVPYELLSVNYGGALREWLGEKFARVDIFVPDDKAFKEIEQDAVVLVAQKKCVENHGFFIQRVQSLGSLVKVTDLQLKKPNIDGVGNKSFLLNGDQVELIEKLRGSLKCVGDFCTSSPGTVTGANNFFILSRDFVDTQQLHDFVKPIIRKGSYIKGEVVFRSMGFDRIAENKPCFLLDYDSIESIDLPPELKSHLSIGIRSKIHERYKCSRRNPWYNVPDIPAADGFIFKRFHKTPKLLVNEMGISLTDVAYHIKIKPDYDIKSFVKSFYNSITLLFSEVEGRFYGGGVLELTPSEFRRLPLPYAASSVAKFRSFEQKFVSNSGDESFFDKEDLRVKSELKLSDNDILLLRSARRTLRDYRLRHGS